MSNSKELDKIVTMLHAANTNYKQAVLKYKDFVDKLKDKLEERVVPHLRSTLERDHTAEVLGAGSPSNRKPLTTSETLALVDDYVEQLMSEYVGAAESQARFNQGAGLMG